MKATLCLTLIFLALWPPTSRAGDDGSGIPTGKSVTVYYFDFAIERITGIHEDGIEHEGCKYSINQRDFLSLLSAAADIQKYQPLDVRAEVIFAPHIRYYIDRKGGVRQRKQYYNINKREFSKLLKASAATCR